MERHFSGESIHYQQIFALLLPIFIDQAFLVLIGMLNTMMISSVGQEAVSALSVVDYINVFCVNIFTAISTGGTVIVSQYKGKGCRESESKAAASSITIVFLTSLLFAAGILVFREPVLGILFHGASDGVLLHSRLYLIGAVVSYPLLGIVESINGALRGAGDAKVTMRISLFMNGLYVLFNLLFIRIFDMGVLGLVTSLLCARFFGMCFALYTVSSPYISLSLHIRDFKPDLAMLKRIVSIGLPFSFEQMFFNGGKLVMQTFIVPLGTPALFVNAIGNTLSSILQIGSTACNLAIVPVVGQCMGRKNVADARKFVRSFFSLSTVLFLITQFLVLLFIKPIVHAFSPTPEVLPDIYQLMLLLCIFNPLLWSGSFIMPSALRAAGDAKFTTLVSLISMWIVRVVLGYLLSVVFEFGVIGIWVAMFMEWGLRCLIFTLRYRGERWYSHRLID